VESTLDAVRAAGSHGGRASRYATFAWTALGANLAVILWGAFVRASGSGAGCGSHWPLCNGEVVPRSPSAATLIELAHRVSSGLALLLVAGLIVGAWRVFPRGHLVRRSAAVVGIFMVLEALIGAGLVLLELVAGNTTIARAWWMAGHLVNTFLLVAALTLTAWWATHEAPPRVREAGSLAVALGLALAGMLVLGVSGAITALGDTLFPVTTLAEGEALTFSGAAHVFVRLRLWHPVLACVVGGLIVAAALHAARSRREATVSLVARALVGVFVLNLAVGALNVWWLAPLPVQLVHLLLADLVWITLVVLTASALATRVTVADRGHAPEDGVMITAEEDLAS
jgi:heme A synthase